MADNSTSVDQIIVSETFHSNFGDFALQSSDGPVFYFPRAILQYSSKVFATMFEIRNASSNDKPILIQADARTLDLLLTFLHPGLSNPPIYEVETLANLLRVATQYEMESTLNTLRGCFAMPFDVAEHNSLITTEPLLSLVIAYSYDYKDIARVSLREVIKCDLKAHLSTGKGFHISFELMGHVYHLRQLRIDQLAQLMHSLTAYAIKYGSKSLRKQEIEVQMRLLREIATKPAFSAVRGWYDHLVSAGLVQNTIQERELLEQWEKNVRLEESELPELQDSLE